MTTPSPRVWLATFVTLVFTIGLFAGIVVDRTLLDERRGPGLMGLRGPGSRVQGPGAGGPGAWGRGGPGAGMGPGRGGQGRGGPMFGPPPRQYVDELDREVDLTDTQRAEILTLLQAQEARLQQQQDEARREFLDEQRGLHERIAALLTPEQATAFRAWVTRRTAQRGTGPR